MKSTIFRTLEAILVMGGAVLAYIFVPHDTLMPMAWAVLVAGVAGVFATKAYIRKLDPATHGPRRYLMMDVGMASALAAFTAFLVLVMAYA